MPICCFIICIAYVHVHVCVFVCVRVYVYVYVCVQTSVSMHKFLFVHCTVACTTQAPAVVQQSHVHGGVKGASSNVVCNER